MIIIRNNIIPFKGFKAMNLCGVIFARKDAVMDDVTLRHESIHSRQCWEMLVIGFYLWYIIEWLIRLLIYRNTDRAYRKIWFEQEAYSHQHDPDYLHNRKHFAWLR